MTFDSRIPAFNHLNYTKVSDIIWTEVVNSGGENAGDVCKYFFSIFSLACVICLPPPLPPSPCSLMISLEKVMRDDRELSDEIIKTWSYLEMDLRCSFLTLSEFVHGEAIGQVQKRIF